jgi:hypothetical protein
LRVAEEIAQFVVEKGFTAVLAPTHYLNEGQKILASPWTSGSLQRYGDAWIQRSQERFDLLPTCYFNAFARRRRGEDTFESFVFWLYRLMPYGSALIHLVAKVVILHSADTFRRASICMV